MAKVMNPVKYVKAQNAAMRLNCATSDEIKVLGLQGLGLALGFSQDSLSVPQMGERVAPVDFTNAKFDEMTVNCNMVPGSESQTVLRAAALQETPLKNVRLYIKDYCDFSAPDQVSEGGGLTTGTSGLNVGSAKDTTADSPGAIWKNSFSFAPAGPFTLFVAHTPRNAGTNLDITAEVSGTSGATIELIDGSNWEDLGFEEGDTIILDYNDASAPPRYGKVDSLSSSTMTLVEGEGDASSITTATGITTTQVHGATPSDIANLSNVC